MSPRGLALSPGRLTAAVAAQLRAERVAALMSNPELAAASGVSLSSVERLLSGRHMVSLDALEALCAGLGVEPLVLMRRASERME